MAANLRIPGTTPYYGANGIQDYVDGYTHEGEFILVAEDGANDLKNYPIKCVKGSIWVNNHAHVLQSKNEIADNKFLAKTGMRFSEALALTPKDFDFAHQTLSISKTWDYKGNGGFQPTKNKSSVRKIQIDWQTVIQFSELVKHIPEDNPIFIRSKVYNSTVNDILARHCQACKIPVISVHGLRHTHALTNRIFK